MTQDYLIGGYDDVTFNSAQESFQWQLEDAGVPTNLASQCAEILARDDSTQEDLGRNPEEQHLIQSAHQWMLAKGFFEE